MSEGSHILLVEDDAPLRESVRRFLQGQGFRVSESGGLVDASRRLAQEGIDLVLLDLTLPDGNGMDILERFGRQYPHRIVVLTGTGSIETAVLAMKKGAHDFLQKPVNPEILLLALQRTFAYIRERRECQELKGEIGDAAGFDKFIYRSETMADVLNLARQYAATGHSILISGETGTGKELMAQAIHASSRRSGRPLVSVNCASIPENLAESELFGYKKGAFTGAFADSPGKFILADGGTILLDEIGELPLNIQAKLLRVLEEGAFRRVGGLRDIPLDVRVIAASNRNLRAESEAGKFRLDLYYRLSVIQIEIPALRERGDDVLILADYYIRQFNERLRKHIRGMSAEVADIFRRYSWPGNVRELRNVIERVMILEDGDLITETWLPCGLSEERAPVAHPVEAPATAPVSAAAGALSGPAPRPGCAPWRRR